MNCSVNRCTARSVLWELLDRPCCVWHESRKKESVKEQGVKVQVHEWSGVFKNLVMASHFRRFRPGLRVAVSLFGGHYWRTQVSTDI